MPISEQNQHKNDSKKDGQAFFKCDFLKVTDSESKRY